MRKESYTVGSIVHVIKRGARGASIVRDESDKWRFLKLLYFLNDKNKEDNWERKIEKLGEGLHFIRPDYWGDRKQLVKILSYCLHNNHFHLLLEEIEEGGISKFMQSLCGSMSMHYNLKYLEKGSLFQGSYKSKTVGDDYYLQLLFVYINFKNPFELYKGGLANAIRNFDDAYTQALKYNFSSLPYIGSSKTSPILDKTELFEYNASQFKKLAKEFLENKLDMMKEENLD